MIWRTARVMAADLAPVVIGVVIGFSTAFLAGWLLSVLPFIGLVFSAGALLVGVLLIGWISNAYERAKKSEQGH
ncbi:hypothetical protein ACFOHK_08835 [Falsigemmobacter intermedius]|uniref:Uncharacterized protein n=1 Tax=Falsigemmobacter intermedius TaxID=1553448 RepID=A0A3S3WB59_9RHOB|nr:hypothetical protein [Falsigemmobacter intermedius]RWY34933.1 hypothetical protein EP867_19080 [Falsigemmobacter intermedius]